MARGDRDQARSWEHDPALNSTACCRDPLPLVEFRECFSDGDIFAWTAFVTDKPCPPFQ
jgi:hypothetical protein